MSVKIKVNRPVMRLNHFLDGLVMIFSFSASKQEDKLSKKSEVEDKKTSSFYRPLIIELKN